MIHTKAPRRNHIVAFPTFGNIVNEIMNAPVKEVFKDEVKKHTIPSVNVTKSDTYFLLDIALPGYSKKDVQIKVDQGKIFISSELENEAIKEYTLREYNYGKFQRSFKLPKNINLENIQATFKNGVLKVELPIIPEKAPKAIIIK